MKKILALILVCLMSVSTVAFAADFSDVEGHWAINAISNAFLVLVFILISPLLF